MKVLLVHNYFLSPIVQLYFPLLALSLFAFVPTTHAFTDVSTSHPHYDAIMWAKLNGIVEGYHDGTFRPDNQINRAEFTKIVAESEYTEAALRICDPNHFVFFTDVDLSSWYSPALCVITQEKTIGGYPDNTFRPANPINYVEAAKIIATRHGGSDFYGPGRTSSNPWYQMYTDYLDRYSAKPPTVYSNDQFITRGEMMYMMYALENPVITSNQACSTLSEEPCKFALHCQATYRPGQCTGDNCEAIFNECKERRSSFDRGTQTSGLKTYIDIHGLYSLELPESWLAISPYDGSYLDFEVLEDGVLGYGDPSSSWSEIYLETIRREDITESMQDRIVEFMFEHRLPENYSHTSRQEDGYILHTIVIDESENARMRVYKMFEREDAVVLLGYPISSTTSSAIINSFQFIPDTLLVPMGESTQNIEEPGSSYVSANAWPPAITIQESTALSCQPGTNILTPIGYGTTQLQGSTCISTSTEGAAGTLYTNYQLLHLASGKLTKIEFTLRQPNCDNYDEPTRSECNDDVTQFFARFDVFDFAERIFQSDLVW